MANPNIFSQYLTPPKSMADYGQEMDRADLARLQLQGQAGQNELLALTRRQQMEQAQQAMADRTGLQRLAQQHAGNPQAFLGALDASGNSGFMDLADKKRKAQADAAHLAAQAARENATAGSTTQKTESAKRQEAIQHIGAFASPQDAMASLQAATDIPPQMKDALVRSMPDDPLKFREWQLRVVLSLANPEQQAAGLAPKMTAAGGALVNTNPLAGAVGQGPSAIPITQSADNLANNARMAAEGAAGRALSRESNAAAMSKPFEVTGTDGAPTLVQQARDGSIVPVTGYTPKGTNSKPLAGAVLKQITEARDNSATIDRLAGSFKPEYAGKGVLGLGADAQIMASGNLGVDKPAVEWWKNYRKQAELIERHALFGAALTPTEQASWRSADIGPGMDADVVAQNLATRKELAAKVLENARQDLIDAGNSETRINQIAGRNAKPAAAGGATRPEAAPAGAFKIIGVK